MPPLVSVIVPVYNGEKYLREALESVFEQDYSPFEVIVIDDGSTDDSARIAQSFAVRYVYQENQGPAAARNKGIEIATGGFIAFIDQDDTWLPGKLSIQMKHLMADPTLLFAVSRQRFFLDEDVEKPGWLRADILNDDQMGYLPGTLLARKRAFEEIGMFALEFPTTSDVDWFFRANDANVPMIVIQEVLLQKRVHRDAQSSYAKQHNQELLILLRRSIQRKKQGKAT